MFKMGLKPNTVMVKLSSSTHHTVCFHELGEKSGQVFCTFRTGADTKTALQAWSLNTGLLNFGNGCIVNSAKHLHRKCTAYLEGMEGIEVTLWQQKKT